MDENIRNAHREQVDSLKSRAENIKRGITFEAFRHPDDPTRMMKISRTFPRMWVPNWRGKMQIREFNRNNPEKWARREFLKQHLLTHILHVLYPAQIPDAFNVKTKSIPRTEAQYVHGQTMAQARFGHDADIVDDSYEDQDIFIIEDGENWEEIFREIATWRTAHLALKNELSALGIEVDAVNIGANYLRTAENTFIYVDSFVAPRPLETARRLERKIHELQDADSQKKCRYWLSQYEKLSSTGFEKVDELWDKILEKLHKL